MKSKRKKPKIMVSSSIYGFENDLTQICALLKKMGYEVLNSYIGTIKTTSENSPLENCIHAVEKCDLFLGIIRTNCGTGYIEDKNITFEEMKKAVEMGKPYWFLAHRDVVFARQLLKHVKRPKSIKFKDKKFFDPLCIEMYNYVIKDTVPIGERKGNWVQEFYKFDEMVTYIKTQFGDKDYINQLLHKED